MHEKVLAEAAISKRRKTFFMMYVYNGMTFVYNDRKYIRKLNLYTIIINFAVLLTNN